MFGFEFSEKKKDVPFPEYRVSEAVSPDSVEAVVPLIWQEHCVECAMPACYGTCALYKKRSDGRCRRFKNGIQRVRNRDALLGQNAVIDMDEWAKLQTFFFTKRLSYAAAARYNGLYCFFAAAGRALGFGWARRLSYYAKEWISRRTGYAGEAEPGGAGLPRWLLCEIVNPGGAYTLLLENRLENRTAARKALRVEPGFNRFWIPTAELSYQRGEENSLCMFPEENRPQRVYFVSLEMADIREDHLPRYFRESENKVKLVVWDLDNTLWDGILSEDGIEGVRLKPEIVEIIRELDAKGIVSSAASKNDEDRAMEALRHFGLAEYFVAPMINWNPKSENIRAIQRALDIGMDTFVFVDDTENELREVRANCPGIRVCGAAEIGGYVRGKAFDVPVTEESRNRRRSYQEIALRNADALRYKDDITRFLLDCRMNMHISAPSGGERERCYELLQRTNQLNLSGERLSREELDAMLGSGEYECFRIKVDDKYGNYGLVGFAAFDLSGGPDVVLRHFVFSCRAARKQLEPAFFEYMMESFRARGFKSLRLKCRRTEKNVLMQSVLAESGLFETVSDEDGAFELAAGLDEERAVTGVAAIFED